MGIITAILRVSEHRKSEKFADVECLIDSGAVYSVVPGKILDDLENRALQGDEFCTCRWHKHKKKSQFCVF